MILVTKGACGHGLELRVVFSVRRSHDDGGRASMFEKNALESGKARRIEMFDHFDDGGGIVAGEARILVHQGALKKLEAFALARRQRIETKPFSGLSRTRGETSIPMISEKEVVRQKHRKEPAFATAKIQTRAWHRTGAKPQGRNPAVVD